MKPHRRSDFQRGALAAAAVVEVYDATSTYSYRLGDGLLAKSHVGNRKPRRNKQAPRSEHEAWLGGFAVALAEMHRRLTGGNDSTSVCKVAQAAGLTLEVARAAGVAAFDLKELKKAGVR